MTLSDTIRKAALGPTPRPAYPHGYGIGGWLRFPGNAFHEVVWAYVHCGGTFEEWITAPEEVQRMFLLFCAEDCES